MVNQWRLLVCITRSVPSFPYPFQTLPLQDFTFHAPDSAASADLRQGNTKPSVQTVRGHMGPAAFLIQVGITMNMGSEI